MLVIVSQATVGQLKISKSAVTDIVGSNVTAGWRAPKGFVLLADMKLPTVTAHRCSTVRGEISHASARKRRCMAWVPTDTARTR
jgi:hypothetical protein